ncbi:MAG: LlaJI family restriction endonuclease [Deltaproteobacteria bacterium]|nr:LlaJI family restriction endonuclease [Deltaproteobacteria bacterium]
MSPTPPLIVLHAELSPFCAAPDSKDYRAARALFEQLTALRRAREEARDEGGGGSFKDFVGFLCGPDRTYICLPKVFSATPLPSLNDAPPALRATWLDRARLLRSALQTYQRLTTPDQHAVRLYQAYIPHRDSHEAEPASHLGLAQLILRDYTQHGPWHDQTHTYARAEGGNTHWARTIARGGELWLNDSSVLYPTPTVKRQQRDHDHPLSLAQRAALADIELMYGPLLHEGPLHLPRAERADLLTRERHPLLAQRLRRALPGLFEQRARRLAGLLLLYLQRDSRGSRDHVDALGTTSFEILFEHMCARCFGTSDDQDLLGLKEEGLGRVEWRFSDLLPQETIGAHRTRQGRSQRPDLFAFGELDPSRAPPRFIVRREQSAPQHILVMDAKYYDLIGALRRSKNSGGAAHLPGLEDVRKQHVYAEFIRQRLGWEESHVSNALLFPIFELDPARERPERGADSPFWNLGEVSLTSATQPPIKVLGVQLDELMRRYVGERPRDAHLSL